MKISTTILLVLFAMLSFQNIAYSATSEVIWTNYEKYRDIHPGNDSKKKFRERTFRDFEKYFAKLSTKLPEGQVLKIEVTDVDLAGDTLAGGIDRYRIVKEIYFPRMNFTYQLINADGSEVKSAEVALKEMNFMIGSSLKYSHDSLGYEKKMLKDWFFKTFKDDIIKNN